MGILNNIITQKKEQRETAPQPVVQTPPPQAGNELNRTELELLLKLLADATLKGRDVEPFYHMILKIQSQYIAKQQ